MNPILFQWPPQHAWHICLSAGLCPISIANLHSIPSLISSFLFLRRPMPRRQLHQQSFILTIFQNAQMQKLNTHCLWIIYVRLSKVLLHSNDSALQTILLCVFSYFCYGTPRLMTNLQPVFIITTFHRHFMFSIAHTLTIIYKIITVCTLNLFCPRSLPIYSLILKPVSSSTGLPTNIIDSNTTFSPSRVSNFYTTSRAMADSAYISSLSSTKRIIPHYSWSYNHSSHYSSLSTSSASASPNPLGKQVQPRSFHHYYQSQPLNPSKNYTLLVSSPHVPSSETEVPPTQSATIFVPSAPTFTSTNYLFLASHIKNLFHFYKLPIWTLNSTIGHVARLGQRGRPTRTGQ